MAYFDHFVNRVSKYFVCLVDDVFLGIIRNMERSNIINICKILMNEMNEYVYPLYELLVYIF